MEVVGWQKVHPYLWGSLTKPPLRLANGTGHRSPPPGPVSTLFVIGSGLLARWDCVTRDGASAA